MTNRSSTHAAVGAGQTWSAVSEPGVSSTPDRTRMRAVRALPAVAPGKSASYTVKVRNRHAKVLRDFRVTHELPAGARFVAANPAPVRQGRRLVWELGTIPPNAEVAIQVTVRREPTGPELPAKVPFDFSFAADAPVRKPRLRLTVRATPGAVKGEVVPFQVRVENAGDGVARNVVLQGRFREGGNLGGDGPLETAFSSLGPGQSTSITVSGCGTSADVLTLLAKVSCAEGCPVAVEAPVVLTVPRVEVSLNGPSQVTTGTELHYQIDVTNPGPVVATVRVVCAVPPELDVVSADCGGSHDPATQEVVWQLEPLSPQASRKLTVRLTARLPAHTTVRVTARAEPAEEASAAQPLAVVIDERESTNLLDRMLAEVERELADEVTTRQARASVPAAATAEEGERFLLFSLADIEYAIRADRVLEVGKPLGITPLPNVPDWLLGLTNVRGDIVSVVDLRTFLGLESARTGPHTRLLIVRAEGEDMTTSLLVDRVRGIRRIPRASFQPPDGVGDDRIAPLVQGVSEHNGSLLLALDLSRLLASQEMQQFELV